MIICGFPGVGKSYAAQMGNGVDLESSESHWIYTGHNNPRRNPNPSWPGNYVNMAIELSKSGKHVFISSHQEVRDELLVRDVFFWVVVPHVSERDAYKRRYEKRGDSDVFINTITKNWCDMLRSCHSPLGGVVYILPIGASLNEVVRYLTNG